MAGSTIALTQNRRIFVPDVKVDLPRPEYIYVPLRGYASHLAVMLPMICCKCEDKKGAYCIGYIDTRALGYENAKLWIKGTNWKDEGY